MKKKGKAEKEVTTVTGIVIPVEWDDHGNALATIISSPGEEEYLVEPYAKGKELLGLVREDIEASGIVKKGTKGLKTIKIESYRLKRAGSLQEGEEPEGTSCVQSTVMRKDEFGSHQ
jgi:hypothetical protein